MAPVPLQAEMFDQRQVSVFNQVELQLGRPGQGQGNSSNKACPEGCAAKMSDPEFGAEPHGNPLLRRGPSQVKILPEHEKVFIVKVIVGNCVDERVAIDNGGRSADRENEPTFKVPIFQRRTIASLTGIQRTGAFLSGRVDGKTVESKNEGRNEADLRLRIQQRPRDLSKISFKNNVRVGDQDDP